MRRFLLAATILLLMVALGGFWMSRFQRVVNYPTWYLADLKCSQLSISGTDWLGDPQPTSVSLSRKAGDPPISFRLAIPVANPVDGLYLQFRLSAENLVRGQNRWEDGRFIIEWTAPFGGKVMEESCVGSIQATGRGGIQKFVILPKQGKGIPFIRLEHLGHSGEFSLSDLKVVAVKESNLWKFGRWGLLIAWIVWCYFVIRSWPNIERWRSVCASCLWVMLIVNFVIPGPWKIQRSMYPEFQLGAESCVAQKENEMATITSFEQLRTGTVPALGRLAPEGSFALKVKLMFNWMRPLLHGLLLFAPTLGMMCLIGSRPSVYLMTGIAFAIELGEIAFGYGCGWDDAGDLLYDAIGIVCAWFAYKWLLKIPHAGWKRLICSA